jgi:KipI family sensor histidine kinase inhibitor
MRLERLSERVAILRDLPDPAWQLARILNAHKWPELEEAVPSYETVGLYLTHAILDLDGLAIRVRELMQLEVELPIPKIHEIPVCYELGEDLASIASALAISTEKAISLHLSIEYQCFAVGFSPGFAYLGYLPDEITGLPRLSSPRVRVEPGSVGITGRQTAVYPSATPGGWNLIGRCPLVLVDVEDGYFPIEAGDSVRFMRIDESEFGKLNGGRL